MSDQLKYKGYIGSIHFDSKELLFYGQIEYIRAVVTYEASTARALVNEFKAAVDDYLITCHAEGIKPEEPFKGTLNVRIGPELHRDIAALASQESVSINAIIKQALQEYIGHEHRT